MACPAAHELGWVALLCLIGVLPSALAQTVMEVRLTIRWLHAKSVCDSGQALGNAASLDECREGFGAIAVQATQDVEAEGANGRLAQLVHV